MPNLATIRTLTIRQTSEGGDAVRRDLDATAAAQTKVGTAAEAAAVVSESAARRQLSGAGAFDRLRASVDSAYRSQVAMEKALGTANRAFQQGATDAATYERTVGLVTARYNGLEQAAMRAAQAQKQAWRDLGGQGADALRNLEAGRKLGSLNGGATGPEVANENRRLRGDQVQNLLYQGSDIVSSLGSGMSPATVLLQQGGQIGQVFAGPGGASIKGAFAQAGEAAAGLASRIGVVGGAFGVLTTAAVAAVAAQQSYSETQTALARQLAGVGRAAGVTAGQINALAPVAAAAGGVSVRSAREMAGEFAATGKIGAEMYTGLIGSVKDYAATTGQQVPDATKALAEAFADPAKGAEILDKQLAVLNDTTRENIQRLAAQGDRLGAQRALLDAYKTGLSSATEMTSAWGRTTAAVGATVSDIWDKVGGTVDRVVTGGDLETRLATAQKVLENSRARTSGIFGTLLPGVAGSDVNTARDQVARLQGEIQKRDERTRQAQQNQTSTRIGDLVRSLDPMGEQIKKISDQAKDIATNLSRLPFDEQGAARRAMDGLVAQAKQLREDMAAGGSEYAAAIRSAQFQQRTIGFTPQGQTAAQINQGATEKEIAARSKPGNSDDINARLQSIEMERVTLLQNLERSTTLEGNQIGGAFSRMSQAVQQQILAAAQDPRFGRIPANIVAAIAEHESGGNLNVGQTKLRGEDGRPATAYGLGQINAPTAAAAVRSGYLPPGFDRTDPSTAAIGIAGVLSMKMGPNGTLEDAIKRYRGSNSDAVNSGYLTDIMRRAGQMGDPSTGAQAREQDTATRALRDQEQALRNQRENYGKNGLILDANAEAMRRYNSQIDAGVPASKALQDSMQGLALQTQTVIQRQKLNQFASDTGFEREQLGRSTGEQSAYSAARSMIGDTSSEAAQFVIAQRQANDNLKQIKDTGQGAFTGLLTDLSHGTSLATSFSGALSKIGDKLLSFASDKLFSSLFGSLLGGDTAGSPLAGSQGPSLPSTGLLGGIGKLFGWAGGGYTGDGGKYEPAGIVHRGEYVIDAATVGRVGRGVFDGLRGYADGGFVTMPNMAAPVPPVPSANMNAPADPGPTQLNVNVMGANGDKQIMSMVQAGVGSALTQYDSGLKRNINGIVAQGQRRYQRAG